MSPMVSVVTPFYNTEKYVEACVRSILSPRAANDRHCNRHELYSKEKNIKIPIIGAGPAGLGAAFNCQRNGLEWQLFEQNGFPITERVGYG